MTAELFGAPRFMRPERSLTPLSGRNDWLEDVLPWAPQFTTRFEELVEPGSFVYFTKFLFGNPHRPITPVNQETPRGMANHIYYVTDLRCGWVEKVQQTAIIEIRAVAVQAIRTKPGEKSVLVPHYPSLINLSPQRAANLNHGKAVAQEYVRSVLNIRYIASGFDLSRLTEYRNKTQQQPNPAPSKVLFPQ